MVAGGVGMGGREREYMADIQVRGEGGGWTARERGEWKEQEGASLRGRSQQGRGKRTTGK